VYEDAEQAAASEPGALGQVHERQRERLVLPGEGDSRWAAEIEAGRLDGLHHDGTRECVERRGLMGRERLASAVAPERLPERSATIPDHDQRPGVRGARSDRMARGHDRVVSVDLGRSDQVQSPRGEEVPQLREKDCHSETVTP
jgi:hypothetical protein